MFLPGLMRRLLWRSHTAATWRHRAVEREQRAREQLAQLAEFEAAVRRIIEQAPPGPETIVPAEYDEAVRTVRGFRGGQP